MIRLTRAQVREIDRRSMEEYHIPGIVLMENAAIGATGYALYMLRGHYESTVCVAVGPGNNGGDGLAMARHIHNQNIRVEIVLSDDPSGFKGDALINWEIVQRLKLPILDEPPTSPRGLWIDSLYGTGLTRPITGKAARIVAAINTSHSPVLAVDIPSGLDADTGDPIGDVCVRAQTTVTFVAEKAGFANPASKVFTGDVYVGDIGCPRELVEGIG